MGLSENGVYLPNGTLIGKIITLDLEGSCFYRQSHIEFLSEIPLKCARGLSLEFTDKCCHANEVELTVMLQIPCLAGWLKETLR